MSFSETNSNQQKEGIGGVPLGFVVLGLLGAEVDFLFIGSSGSEIPRSIGGTGSLVEVLGEVVSGAPVAKTISQWEVKNMVPVDEAGRSTGGIEGGWSTIGSACGTTEGGCVGSSCLGTTTGVGGGGS